MVDTMTPATVPAIPAASTGIQVTTMADMKARLELMEYVVSKMVEGVDYGVIPRTTSKTLFLPGGELLRMAFNVPIQFEELDRTVEYDGPGGVQVFYRVRGFCIDPGGHIHYQSMRSCSSREPRWNGWTGDRRYELIDLVPERAQKRAFLDVVRHMTAADRYFKGASVDASEAVDASTGEVANSQEGYDSTKCPAHGTRWYENTNGGFGHKVSGKSGEYCTPARAWGDVVAAKAQAAGIEENKRLNEWFKANFNGKTWSKLTPDEIVTALLKLEEEAAAKAFDEVASDEPASQAAPDGANSASEGVGGSTARVDGEQGPAQPSEAGE